MGYKIIYSTYQDNPDDCVPILKKDTDGGTVSWREAKKALRQWYLERAKALRNVSEKDYFHTGSED